MYLDAGVVKDVRARFKNESEIELQEFLLVRRCLRSFNTFSSYILCFICIYDND